MRLIDAEVLANWIDGSQRLDTEHDYEEVARYIEECPTVDAVPVVRCRECKHADKYHHCSFANWWPGAMDYCSHGKRREEDTWEPNETDLKAMLDAGHETFVRVFSQDAKMDKEVESGAAD